MNLILSKYKVLIFLFILVIRGSLFSQPSIEWQRSYGGTSFEAATSVIQTNDGGFAVVGFTASNDGDVTGLQGESDIWIIKLDFQGIIQWQKCLGGSLSDRSFSIQQTTDNGYILAGFTFSVDGDVTGNHGTKDGWVIKLDNLGNIQWQKCYGGSNQDEFNSIQQTSDGGFIISGRATSIDGDILNHFGVGSDFWVVKTNNIGNIEWSKCYGGSDVDESFSIQQTSDGGYILCGLTSSSDGDVTGYHNNWDYWILKIDNIGSFQWQKCIGGSGGELASSVKQTSDGGFIVAGGTGSSDGDIANPIGPEDIWLIKLNANGVIDWQKCLGGTNDDVARSIELTTDGGYIIVGTSSSNDVDVSGHHGDSSPTGATKDIWVVKTNASGMILWQKSIGGIGGEEGYSIKQTSDNGYIVCGYSGYNDGDVTDNNGEHDYWVIKLSSDLSVDSISHLEPKKLVKILNILGQETEIKNNEMLFYRYSDGSIEKKIIID